MHARGDSHLCVVPFLSLQENRANEATASGEMLSLQAGVC